jgi:hypothetical protein
MLSGGWSPSATHPAFKSLGRSSRGLPFRTRRTVEKLGAQVLDHPLKHHRGVIAARTPGLFR